MMLPMIVLFESIARAVVAVLLNSLWQGALIAFGTWVLLRAFPRANASTRYAMWCLALVAVVAAPVATSLTSVSVVRSTNAVPVRHPSVRVPAPHSGSVVRTVATTEPAVQSVAAQPPHPQIALPQLAALIVFLTWSAFVAVVAFRLAVALWQLERLKRDALPLDVAYRDTMAQWQAAAKGGRDVRICVTENIDVPIAVGLFDAMVLLPSRLLATLEPGEIDQISLHELAHLLRNDDWSNGLQRAIGALFFFNPAVWFIARQLDIEREVACDDYVLELTGAVRPYAFCLTKMAEMTPWPHRALAAPGVFMTRKNISIRIERLLRSGRVIGVRIAPGVAAAVTVALLALFLVLRTMTPSIAYTLPAPQTIAQSTVAPPEPSERPHSVQHATPHNRSHVSTNVTTPISRAIRAQVTASTLAAMHAQIVAGTATWVGTKAARSIANSVDTRVAARSATIATKSVEKAMKEQITARSAAAATLVTAEMATQVASANGNFACTGCDFSNTNLAGKDFRGRAFVGSDFSGANLQNARFDDAVLTGVDFSNADLRNVSFMRAKMSGCDLSGAKLSGAHFDGAQLSGCDIDIAGFVPAQALQILKTCVGCDARNANFDGQNLSNIHLSGVNFEHANFHHADLSGAVFSGVDFSHANLSEARLDGTAFIGCDFDGVDLRNVDLSRAKITGSSLKNAILY